MSTFLFAVFQKAFPRKLKFTHKTLDKQVNGNEVIYSFKIEQQDGSTKPDCADLRIVVFKDKQTGEWLVDPTRSEEETVTAKEAKEKK